jgi:hypothetical protein
MVEEAQTNHLLDAAMLLPTTFNDSSYVLVWVPSVLTRKNKEDKVEGGTDDGDNIAECRASNGDVEYGDSYE